jgi:hypothetical protein
MRGVKRLRERLGTGRDSDVCPTEASSMWHSWADTSETAAESNDHQAQDRS